MRMKKGLFICFITLICQFSYGQLVYKVRSYSDHYFQTINGRFIAGYFYYATEFKDEPYVALVVKKGGRYRTDLFLGFIDASGKYLFPPIECVVEDNTPKYRKNGFAFVDNIFIFPLKISWQNDDRWGAVDLLGNLIVPFKYKSVDKVIKSKEWRMRLSFVSEREELYKSKLREIYFQRIMVSLRMHKESSCFACKSFKRGNAALEKVRKNGKYGVVDRLFFNDLIEAKYDEIFIIDKEAVNKVFPAKVAGNDCYSFIDYKGDSCGYGIKTDSICDKLYLDKYMYRNISDGKIYYLSGISSSIQIKSFVENYVLLNMNYWMSKNEFETVEEYAKRTKDEFLNLAKEYYTKCAVRTYLDLIKSNIFQLCDYDASNNTFLVKSEIGDVVIKVPYEQSMTLREHWPVPLSDINFESDEHGIRLHDIIFEGISGEYICGNNDLPYNVYNVDQQKAIVNIRINSTKVENGQGESKDVYLAQSDVDENIPVSYMENKNTFAVIIANENYEEIPKVSFAHRDGSTFGAYCERTLGLPKENIFIYEDATSGKIIDAVEKIKLLAQAYKGQAKILFYYAGHGLPDERKSAYLMPVDGSAYNISRTGYSLQHLYNELGNCDAELVTVFLDACFSGITRENSFFTEDRGVEIDLESGNLLQGNLIVFSASNSLQKALSYKEKKHGMFTYFLLKKLQESRGDISYWDLFNYVNENVHKMTSRTQIQIPGYMVSPNLYDGWKNMKVNK